MVEGKKSARKETKQEKDEEKKIDEIEALLPKEIVEVAAIPIVEEISTEIPKIAVPEGWVPKTKLGKDVSEGKVKDIDEIFSEGVKITEPEIVDVLIPNLQNEIILIGGSTGKGGGIRRTPSKRTARMHKSGRRYRISVMIVVGNQNGYVGVGLADGPPGRHREVIEKALHRAKLDIIPIRRGCGSWECRCGMSHSIPISIEGRSGSIKLKLIPAPKGVGLVVSDEIKKLMRLAGIKDIWCKTRGKTQTRINLVFATFDALKKLDKFRIQGEQEKNIAVKLGRVD